MSHDPRQKKERPLWRVWSTSDGWEAAAPDHPPLSAPSLEAVVASLPSGHPYELCLPQACALFATTDFPKVPREELVTMLGLQTERLFCLEESTCSLALGRVVDGAESQRVVVWAVPHSVLQGVLGEIERLPRALVLRADLLAAEPGPTRLWMFREGDEVVVALVEGGELAWTTNLPVSTAGDQLESIICQAAMALTLDQPESDPRRILYMPEVASWAAAWSAHSQVPAEAADPALPTTPARISWTPAPWQAQEKRAEHGRWGRRALVVLAALYCLFIGWKMTEWLLLNRETDQLRGELAAMTPVVEQIENARSLWNRVAPVTERRRSPIEILDTLARLVPSGGRLFLTKLDINQDGFTVEAETEDLSLAFAFAEGIQQHDAWQFERVEPGQPTPVRGKKKWRLQIAAMGWQP